MNVKHECHLTSSMWQPTFGPHDLVRMHGSINGHKVLILIDNGALHNFLNYKLFMKLKLQQTKSNHVYKVEMIFAHDFEVWDTYVENVALVVQGHTMTLSFQVMHMSRTDVALRHEWFHGLGSSLKRSYQHNTFAYDESGVYVLLMGEQDVPASPLICNAKLTCHMNNNKICNLVLGYLLPVPLSTNEYVIDMSMTSNEHETDSCVSHLQGNASLALKESSSSQHNQSDVIMKHGYLTILIKRILEYVFR